MYECFRADPAQSVLWVGDRPVPAMLERHDSHGLRLRTARIMFESGWVVSVIWGTGTRSTNHGVYPGSVDEFTDEPQLVEVAVVRPCGGLIDLGGDTVAGWCDVPIVAGVLDAVATWATDGEGRGDRLVWRG
jgi:hypothetical protein